MRDIYEGDLEQLSLSNVEIPDAPKLEPQKPGMDLADRIINYYNSTASISTEEGQFDRRSALYNPNYEKIKKLTGLSASPELRVLAGVPMSDDTDAPGPDQILAFMHKNNSRLKELKAQGHDILDYDDILKAEGKEVSELQTKAQDNWQGSFTDWAGLVIGGAAGYVAGDKINAASLLLGGTTKLSQGILSNMLRIGMTETLIEANLQLKDKPGEVRARQLAGEDLSTTRALAESAISVSTVGATAGLIGGAVRGVQGLRARKSPEDVVNSIADRTPEGMDPKEYVTQVLAEAQKASKAEVKLGYTVEDELVEPDIIIDENLNQLTKEFRQEDLAIKQLDEDGVEISSTSTKQIVEDYEQDKDILTNIRDCLL